MKNAKKTGKGAKPAPKETKGRKAPAKAPPPAKGKKGETSGNTTPATPKKKRESAGAENFRALLEDGKEVKKQDVFDKLVAAGVKPGTANSYIVWAKRPIANPIKNPFGFRIEETKDAKGVKFLQRVAKKGK